MTIVGGLDVHRKQITFDYLDAESGEVRRGRISPPTRRQLGARLSQLNGAPAAFAVEGCTGWRFVIEELLAAGIEGQLADTVASRGPKRRAKTDQWDSQHFRELLVAGAIAESWIPRTHVLEARSTVRVYKVLADERTVWRQRIHAQLFHQGVPAQPQPLTAEGRVQLNSAEPSAAANAIVELAPRMVDTIGDELAILRAEIAQLAATHLVVGRSRTTTALGQ